MKLLHELVGLAAENTIFRRDSIAPRNLAQIQLSQSASGHASSHSNLSVTDVAVLAYMWQAKFFTVDSEPEVFRIISSSLHTSDTERVQRVLEVARTGKWRPGRALTQNLRASLGLDPKGQDQIPCIVTEKQVLGLCICLLACMPNTDMLDQ